MMRFIFIILTLFLSSCATLIPTMPDRSHVDMVLSKTSSDKWLLTANFEAPQSHLIFTSSDGDFRKKTWTLLSPGRFETHFGIDSLHFETPTRQVNFEIRPEDGRVRMSRFPFFQFSDGGMIILSKQFYMVPAINVKQVIDLRGDLTRWRGYKLDHTLKITGGHKAYIDGKVVTAETATPIEQATRIIYTGPSPLIEYESFRGAMDPNLPSWIRTDVDRNVGKIISALRELTGQSLPSRPDLFFMGDPDSDKYFAYSGVAFPDQTLALKVEGEAIKSETTPIFHEIMFFYAHEIAHLFQHVEDIGRTEENAAWISEGTANLMGYRTISKAGLTDAEFINTELRNAYKSCRDIMSGSIAFGRTAVQSRYYDCGLLVALITEAALPRDDIFSFWNALVKETLADEGIYDRSLYFQTMKDLGADKAVVQALEKLVETHIENSQLFEGPDLSVDLDTLLSNVGLSPRFTPSGGLIDMAWE